MPKPKPKNSDRKLSEFIPSSRVQIENVVASTTIGIDIDLKVISQKLDGAEYKPERFPGVVLRTEHPKAAALIFRSGKIVCTGAKSVDDVHGGLERVFEKMRSIGLKVAESPEVTIQNIVASADLEAELDLDAISVAIGLENVEYEPEMFPGLVYRISEPKTVVLLFGSGKMIIAGAKKAEDCERAVEKVMEELENLNLLEKR